MNRRIHAQRLGTFRAGRVGLAAIALIAGLLGPAASRQLLDQVPGTAALWLLPRGARGWTIVREESQ